MDQNKIIKFDEKRLFNFIKEQAKTIREQSLDREQLKNLSNRRLSIINAWERFNRNDIGDLNLIYEAIFELALSFEIAFSNYRKENKNMWTAIFGFGTSKLKEFDPKIIFERLSNNKII